MHDSHYNYKTFNLKEEMVTNFAHATRRYEDVRRKQHSFSFLEKTPSMQDVRKNRKTT